MVGFLDGWRNIVWIIFLRLCSLDGLIDETWRDKEVLLEELVIVIDVEPKEELACENEPARPDEIRNNVVIGYGLL